MPCNANRARSLAKSTLSLVLVALYLAFSPCAHSQTSSGSEASLPTASDGITSGRTVQAKPVQTRLWADLTLCQQQALAPLSSQWAGLSERQQRTWIRLSQRYVRMTPQQQTRLQDRMMHWAALSSDQREKARLRFAETQRSGTAATPEQWRAYQALSPDSKHQLRRSARSLPPRTALRAQATTGSTLKRMTWRSQRAHSAQQAHRSQPQRLSNGAKRAVQKGRGH
jgi:hypothetical protein